MRKLINLPEPDNRLKTLLVTTLILLILSSMWIFYDLYTYFGMRANPVPEEFPDNGLGIGIIIRILLYASFAFMMFNAFKSGLKTSTLTVICTLTGLTFTVFADVSLHDWVSRNWLINLILFYCMVIILPWLLMVISWLLKFARRVELSMYDEKQKQDLAISGLTAWLASIPVMAVVFLFDYSEPGSATGFLWLPYYLFSTLFIFSLSMLLRFRKG